VDVLIVTISDDLHALAVQDTLRRRGLECCILESDAVSGGEVLSFLASSDGTLVAHVQTSEGDSINVAEVELVWWRRAKALQCTDGSLLSKDQKNLINNDCTSTAIGIFESCFVGHWISSPHGTEFASNKLNQLSVAHKCGFATPDTLITQSPAEVLKFYEKHQGRIIMKPVAGTQGPLLFTQFVRGEHLSMHDSIRACPTIYQQFIPGSRHIRLNCFGECCYASVIESESLDWRPNLNVPVAPWTVPDALSDRIRHSLDLLGLEMGIFDLKETADGEPVWLEVNPQGQFLFLEGLTAEPLTDRFAEFLQDRLRRAVVRTARIPSEVLPKSKVVSNV
jgi:hypothetical protein